MTLKEILQNIWLFRGRFPLFDFPVPCALPYGGRFLAYGDMTGLKLLSYRIVGRKSYEEESWRFVSKFLKPGMTFFDVGANQGFFSILAARSVGTNGKVFAFEPAPTERAKLMKNLAINRFNNVTIIPEAVGATVGLTEFHLCLDQGPCSSIRPQADEVNSRTKILEVPVTTLDMHIQSQHIASLDFIKIDVEGGELDVLIGAKHVFNTLRPLLMCEMADIRTRQWGYAASEIYDHMLAQKYLWFSLSDRGCLQKSETRKEYLDHDVNLVAIPLEKTEDVFRQFGETKISS